MQEVDEIKMVYNNHVLQKDVDKMIKVIAAKYIIYMMKRESLRRHKFKKLRK